MVDPCTQDELLPGSNRRRKLINIQFEFRQWLAIRVFRVINDYTSITFDKKRVTIPMPLPACISAI